MIRLARSDRLFSLQIRDGEITDDPDGLASTTRWYVSNTLILSSRLLLL